MTTGERLVEISTLTTGTALEHFLNISTGSIIYGQEFDVEVLELEAIMVDELEPMEVQVGDSDLNVEMVQKETPVTKESEFITIVILETETQ